MKRVWWFIFDSWRGIDFPIEGDVLRRVWEMYRWNVRVWCFTHPAEPVAVFMDEAKANAYKAERAMG